MSNLKKVVWAIDPFHADGKTIHNTASTIQALVASSAQIEPVYVLGPDNLNWTGDFSGRWLETFKPMAEEKINKSLKEVKLPCKAAKILVNKSLSLRSDVKKVLNYATGTKTQLLVLNTQARSGLSRIFLGSFAETALLLAKQPILLVNPNAEAPQKIGKILFATDLSSAGKKAYLNAGKLAKSLGSEMYLYHKLPDPIEPMVQAGVHAAGGGWVSVHDFLIGEGKQRRADCEKWADISRKVGVKTQVFVDDGPGFVFDGINKYAEKIGADLIMVPTKATTTSAFLIGSVARQMARHSQRPILVGR